MIIRQATSDDLGFVYETFLRSIRIASTHVEDLSNAIVIKMLVDLISKGWSINVAEAEGYLAGWIVSKPETNYLAWVYVRDMFRNQGVATKLLFWAGIDTKKKIVTPFLPNRNKRNWQFVHRPFLVL